eukprot:m.221272 g.221272  ORF g.221272 m.221272 type:complete len:101 (-) comp15127_c0_seq9:539-841(-)
MAQLRAPDRSVQVLNDGHINCMSRQSTYDPITGTSLLSGCSNEAVHARLCQRCKDKHDLLLASQSHFLFVVSFFLSFVLVVYNTVDWEMDTWTLLLWMSK